MTYAHYSGSNPDLLLSSGTTYQKAFWLTSCAYHMYYSAKPCFPTPMVLRKLVFGYAGNYAMVRRLACRKKDG
jgi:hypothetical protein